MVQLTDTLTIDGAARICADGCLVAEVNAARVGIQDYQGREVDPDNSHGLRDKAVVKVFRPEEEVFKDASLASYAAAPVTVNHPAEMVDAQNWKQHGVGEINGDIVRDGQRVRVPVIVRDASAVQKAQTTHKQLSMGYSTTLDFTPGTTPDGAAYDAVQRDIRINHIALVPVARGGPELRIVDERPKETTMKIKIGDAEVDAANGEAVRIAVDALNKKLTDGAAALVAAEAKAVADAAAIVAKDAEIADLTAKLADAAITPAKLADAAKEYADVQAKAKVLGVTVAADADTSAIKKAVVDAKMGDKAKAYTADHIAIAFDSLTAGVKIDDAASNGVQPIGAPKVINDGASAVDAARKQWLADKSNAHRSTRAA
jgi:hypothetical protein